MKTMKTLKHTSATSFLFLEAHDHKTQETVTGQVLLTIRDAYQEAAHRKVQNTHLYCGVLDDHKRPSDDYSASQVFQRREG